MVTMLENAQDTRKIQAAT